MHALDFSWVQDQNDFLQLKQRHSGESIWSVDTEFIRERTYFPHLALIQIRVGNETVLLEPDNLSHSEAVAAFLSQSDCVKVFHSCREDIEVLQQFFRVEIKNVWDTQLAEALLGGEQQLSYQKIVERYTGKTIDKGESRSDWTKRPLSSAQLKYAVEDVAWLAMIQEKQQEKLIELGRLEWYQEEISRVLNEVSSELDSENLHLGFRRAYDLDDKRLRQLRDVLHWREQKAQEKNLPRSFILKNDELLQLIESDIESLSDLKKQPRIHPAFIKRYGQILITILEGQHESCLPTVPAQAKPLLNRASDKKILKALKQQVGIQADKLNIEPAVLGSRKDMENWLHYQLGHSTQASRIQQGFRAKLFQQTLKDMEELMQSDARALSERG